MPRSVPVLIDYFVRGGWVMWPILGASVVAFALVLNRLLFHLRIRGDAVALRREVLHLVDEGRIAQAQARAESSPIPVGSVLAAGLSAWGLPQEELERRLEQEASAQLQSAEALLPLLASMVAVLPMFGFLGTILGLIQAFGAWASAGASVTIELLSAGIAQAMITTAAGLLASIPYVLAYNAFSAASARLAHALNAAGSELAGRHRLRGEPKLAEARPAPLVPLSVGGTR